MSTSRDTQLLAESEERTVRDPIMTEVFEKPQVELVKDIKNVSVIHKDVVQEIHEQPIIEIAKRLEVVHVQEQPFVQNITAPTKYEDIKNFDFEDTPAFNIQKAPVHTEEIGDVRHVNLDEDVKLITKQEFVERHIIPTVTEIREQKVINVIEQPIIRTITEKPIIREVTLGAKGTSEETGTMESTYVMTLNDEMRDSSLERERQIPAVQESTHVLLQENPHGPFSELEFAEEVARGKAFLHSARPLSSEAFQEEIKFGDEILHTGRPFAVQGFELELQAGKTALKKSRYFSKDAFILEFMAQKKLLNPVEGSRYSEELGMLGNWKSETFGKQILDTATGFLWNTYESISHKVADTYESLKDRVLPQAE